MLALYQVTSVQRSFRKTNASKQVGRTSESVAFGAKLARKRVRVLVADAVDAIAVSRVKIGRHRRKLAYESMFLLRKLASKTRRLQQRARFKVGSALRQIK